MFQVKRLWNHVESTLVDTAVPTPQRRRLDHARSATAYQRAKRWTEPVTLTLSLVLIPVLLVPEFVAVGDATSLLLDVAARVIWAGFAAQYLILFYLIAYFVVGSFMAAIGAAVNEPREAQSFMMPVMMVMMIPWILWFPISRDPNTLFATLASFTPPINTFVMLLRMTSTSPPPIWQVWLSILIGLASVYAALWFAAKVFRVGLLLHGKPPSWCSAPPSWSPRRPGCPGPATRRWKW